MIEYADSLNTDEPRYVCIEGDCPRPVLPQGVTHSMRCRDSNVRANTVSATCPGDSTGLHYFIHDDDGLTCHDCGQQKAGVL